ncbi:DUF262 domain-containing protein [Candidatus Parabeggiatoa sp. HSG14]|uniref:GmrSD restriction endonuclease domain-containing protein n=1 Tax=Candidatus Parabeggiatoa sp. HSG14 TaxID=3055593 RepID=UPI0025A91214|nr:DUF262 domain-containing protein [Thiotrichales bacterium HSG14]
MQTINYDLVQLLRKIRAGHFVIPQFQRDFTWKEGQTRLLIDSIARNYPIGSLLVLGKNDEIPLKSRNINAVYPISPDGQDNNENGSIEPTPETYYVLDGQQRLTSIARIFLDSHPKRNYYFDLKQMLEIFYDDSPLWIVSRLRGRKNPDRKDNNKLVRSDVVLIQEKCDVYISEYIEDSGDFPQFEDNRNAAREAAAKIKGIFEIIRNYSIPFVQLENDAPLESVCRVFETINSTGTRLTTFDLAVARYYPDPDLKDFYDSSKEKYHVLREFEVDGERVLQILSLYQLQLNGKFPEATRKVMLSLKPEFIKTHWENAVLNLNKAYEWVRGLGATPKTQPPHSLLVSIATFLMVHSDSLGSGTGTATSVLKKWYFCSTLTNNPAPATNYKIGDDFGKFSKYLTEEMQIQYPTVHFTSEEIIEIKHFSDGRYKAIQGLMKMTAKEDLITGNQLLDNDDAEDHHIFPYSLAKSNGINRKKLNSIANRIIISKESNREISNTHPEKYLGDLVDRHNLEGNVGDFNRRLQNCFMPYTADDPDFKSKLSKENFDLFLSDRAKLIIARIKEVVGDAWKEPNIDNKEEKNLEEDEYVTV